MKSFVILALALASAAAAADFRDVNRTVALGSSGSVEIETHKGSIKVSVWDRHEVEIQARIIAEPGSTMDRRRFDATNVRIESTTNSVRIKTEYPDSKWCCADDGNNLAVQYTIKMPRTARLSIEDHRSDTEISGLQGALDLTTYRGTARVHGLGGALHLETYRGEAHVDFSSFNANSTVKTYRGTVDLMIPKTSRFELQTDAGRRGAIFTDFTVVMRAASRRGETSHGTVNGGGPSLRLEAERGEIRVHAK